MEFLSGIHKLTCQRMGQSKTWKRSSISSSIYMRLVLITFYTKHTRMHVSFTFVHGSWFRMPDESVVRQLLPAMLLFFLHSPYVSDRLRISRQRFPLCPGASDCSFGLFLLIKQISLQVPAFFHLQRFRDIKNIFFCLQSFSYNTFHISDGVTFK